MAPNSHFFWQMYSHYDRLTKEQMAKFKSILEEVISRMDEYKKDIASLQEYCNNLNEEGNPTKRLVFTDSTLRIQAEIKLSSLVDATNTGIVISALYSRSGTRWYAKKVPMEREQVELSDEERKSKVWRII